MTVLIPEATPVLGNLKASVVDAIADLLAPKVETELTAATSVDISCFIRSLNPEITANTGQAPDRACTTVQLPQEGRTTYAPIELRYVYDPQGDDEEPENALKAKLVRGAVFFLPVRKGDPFTTPYAVGDHFEIWKVRAGRQNRVTSGDDEFSEYEISQNLLPMAEVAYGVAVA